jgi:hypothetical protein
MDRARRRRARLCLGAAGLAARRGRAWRLVRCAQGRRDHRALADLVQADGRPVRRHPVPAVVLAGVHRRLLVGWKAPIEIIDPETLQADVPARPAVPRAAAMGAAQKRQIGIPGRARAAVLGDRGPAPRRRLLLCARRKSGARSFRQDGRHDRLCAGVFRSPRPARRSRCSPSSSGMPSCARRSG